MYPNWAGPAVAGFLAAWIAVLTFWIFKQKGLIKALFPKSGERDIRKKFEEVLKEIESFNRDLAQIKDKLAEVERGGQLHIQRVALTRYNPYEDTGGNISFSVALLDSKGSGVVVTSLHARSGTRVFAKDVSEGKMGKYQFSKEEQEAVRKALES